MRTQDISSELRAENSAPSYRGRKILKGQKGNAKEREEDSAKNPAEAYLAVAAEGLSQAM